MRVKRSRHNIVTYYPQTFYIPEAILNSCCHCVAIIRKFKTTLLLKSVMKIAKNVIRVLSYVCKWF